MISYIKLLIDDYSNKVINGLEKNKVDKLTKATQVNKPATNSTIAPIILFHITNTGGPLPQSKGGVPQKQSS